MKTKSIVITLVLLAIAALVFYRIQQNSGKNQQTANRPGNAAPLTVDAHVVVPKPFANSLLVSGSIEANEQVEVRSEVSGVVRGIYFKEGSMVAKGQTLVKIDDIELRAQLAEAQVRQQLASENERRAKLLLEKEAISQEEYDVANAELKSAGAQAQLIQAQISKTALVAPFSGKIGLRYVSPGSYVTPTTLIANLVNDSQVKITFAIPEKYANLMKVDTQINFTVAGSPESFPATVYAVEPEVETTTRTQQIRALAQNPNNKLVPGTYASISVPLETNNNAILIPTQAVIPIQNGKKVFVSEGGKAKEIIIETSTRTDQEIWVTSGLKAGDTVLTTGIMSLRNGVPVKVNITNAVKP